MTDVHGEPAAEAAPVPAGPGPVITVLDPGPYTVLEDFGRPGAAAFGLGPSGALDRGSLATANLAVGNAAGAPALEVMAGRAEFRFEHPAVIALAGAAGPATVDGQAMAFNVPVLVRAGAVLRIGLFTAGMRGYLAVRGGFRARLLFGSASTDALSGMGPAALLAGDKLFAGSAGLTAASGPAHSVQNTSLPAAAAPPPPDESGCPPGVVRDPPRPGAIVVARITPGPRLDHFSAGAWQRLRGQEWLVRADSNRVGLRLDGRPLGLLPGSQLPSEGMVSGALQVPPSGLPVVFLADHPVTGGYPVIAVVRSADLDLLGQLRPGTRLRFL